MPPPFAHLTKEEFLALLRRFSFTRSIKEVHVHHTYRPNHAQYKGHDSIVGMWRVHAVQLHYRDIAQHITIAPDGTLWLGRNWNWSPASSPGANGTDEEGPFMFETIGDFSKGKDVLKDEQLRTAIDVITHVQRRFGLPPEAFRFHRQLLSTECPGTGVDYDSILSAVRAAHEALNALEAPGCASSTAGESPDDVLILPTAFGEADAIGAVFSRPDIETTLTAWSTPASTEPEPADAGCALETSEDAIPLPPEAAM